VAITQGTTSDTGNLVGTVSAGVENLASAATAALGQSGPIGALAQPVVDILRNVWEGYFGSPIPAGGTNWNSYTHQQLYDMLWHHADVGDVGSVASDWGQHSTALTNQAGALRDQSAAMQSNWTGTAAESATGKLGQLSDRTHGIGTRAGTVAQATQHAGDALANARNTMPPPPGDQTGLAVAGVTGGAGIGAAIGAVLGAGAGGIGAGPGALMGAAIGAVAGGAASLFLASVMAAEKKAEAVRVMTTYESGLHHSSGAIAGTPAGATTASAFGLSTNASSYVGGSVGGVGSHGGGTSWGSLVGGGNPFSSSVSEHGAADMAAVARSGVLAEELAAQEMAATELASQRAVGNGMMPGAAGRGRSQEDTEHRNRMPVIDHQLFSVDERTAVPVIGGNP
jgi:uncharacterized protein YukE